MECREWILLTHNLLTRLSARRRSKTYLSNEQRERSVDRIAGSILEVGGLETEGLSDEETVGPCKPSRNAN